MSAAAQEMRTVLRQFLRLARSFPNYNMRHYLHRRATEEARALAAVTDAAALEQALQQARHDLQVWQRQSVVYGMYGRKLKNVLELKAAGQQ